MKKKSSPGKDLRYRLRQKGYEVINKCKVVIVPADESKRSKVMEKRIEKEFKYRIQYNMKL